MRIDDKYRVPLRLGCVALGYVAYRLLEATHFAGGLLVGLGIWLAGVSLVERAMTGPVERQGKIQSIGTVLGLLMIVIGIMLVVA
ncbi:MAG: hypothetical protein M3124_02265 [Actinomycetota bacterium]|nr:hypothetical protein [Actinomycetota bacterium]